MTTPTISPHVLQAAVQGDTFWERQLARVFDPHGSTVALHLAILIEPYLQRILDGRKTVESRFASDRRAPYQQVRAGDVIVLKRSGGPITGIALVADTYFYELTPALLDQIRAQFGDQLGISDPTFWPKRARASFATLIRLAYIRPLPAIPYHKRDQRAWIILKSRSE